MKTDEHVVLNIDTYDDFKAQEKVFEESKEMLEKENRNLRDRKLIVEIKNISPTLWKWYKVGFVRSDDEVIQATFDELKGQHKKEIDKLMKRNLLKRLFNTKP